MTELANSRNNLDKLLETPVALNDESPEHDSSDNSQYYEKIVIYMIDKVSPILLYTCGVGKSALSHISIETEIREFDVVIKGIKVSVPVLMSKDCGPQDIDDVLQWLNDNIDSIQVLLQEKSKFFSTNSMQELSEFMKCYSNESAQKLKDYSSQLMELAQSYIDLAKQQSIDYYTTIQNIYPIEPKSSMIREKISDILSSQIAYCKSLPLQSMQALSQRVGDVRDVIKDTSAIAYEGGKHLVIDALNTGDGSPNVVEKCKCVFERIQAFMLFSILNMFSLCHNVSEKMYTTIEGTQAQGYVDSISSYIKSIYFMLIQTYIGNMVHQFMSDLYTACDGGPADLNAFIGSNMTTIQTNFQQTMEVVKSSFNKKQD